MANEEQLAILKSGVEAWNAWRREHPQEIVDLSGTSLMDMNLRAANLSGANLSTTKLYRADLERANLFEANLFQADFFQANMCEANLNGAGLFGANLNEANLHGANLSSANLILASLRDADLSGVSLTGANLNQTVLIRTQLQGANITSCRIYGIAAWDLQLDEATQQANLIITPENQPTITVDNLEVAQFVYLLLTNEKIRDAINTIGKKAVLILGRFTPEPRKRVLDALRGALRSKGYLPIVFDFERPTDRDFTETIKTLAGLCLFVIADITNPRSSPLELQATVPDYMLPFVPILEEGEQPFAMFQDLQNKYDWVTAVQEYDSVQTLVAGLESAVITPALEVHDRLLQRKAQGLRSQKIREILTPQ